MPDPAIASCPAITAAALLIEAAIGYPTPLFRLIRHPVVWIGTLIAFLDRRLNRGPEHRGPEHRGPQYRQRGAGAAALLLVLAATGAVAADLQVIAESAALPWATLLVLGILGSTLLAQRSLAAHVAAVATGLAASLREGRQAVAHIVGRDPETLDAPAIARAAIESLAENFADGVTAPALYGCLLGLPGMALYKAANTADSMLGHRTPRHERFGWAAARFDDLVNLPASRLAAFWLAAAALLTPGTSATAALRAIRRDARLHRSPNAGWPEAAMAGALGLRLAGPRTYAGVRVDDAWMGEGRADATPADITRALSLYKTACTLQLAAAAALALALALTAPG